MAEVRAAPALAEGGGPAAGGPAELRLVQAATWQLLREDCGVDRNAGFLAPSIYAYLLGKPHSRAPVTRGWHALPATEPDAKGAYLCPRRL